MNIWRIISDLVIAIAVMNGWWFIALPIGLVAVWRFPGYIELLLAGVAYDALFGFTHATGILGYAGTFTAAIVTILILILKKVMR